MQIETRHTERIDWLESMLVDEETGEIVGGAMPQAVEADLAEGIESKIDYYAEAIRAFEANAAHCAEERKRWAIREKLWNNRIERVKEWIAFRMIQQGTKKVQTAATTASLVTNGGKQAIDVHGDIGSIPDEYLKWEPRVDTEAVRAALESGVDLPFARLMERGTSLRIK